MTERPEAPSAGFSSIRSWLLAYEGIGAAASMVPGAAPSELRYLKALGALTASLVETVDVRGDVRRAITEIEGLHTWLTDNPAVPEPIHDAALELLRGEAEDALATLYSTTVSARSRRRLGTFFTPEPEVSGMVNAWKSLETRAPASVVDVGAGVGIFTMAAARAWPATTVHAVDVNPATLGLLGLRIAEAQNSTDQRPTAPIQLVHADYLAWVESAWDRLPTPRLILGNPPYTRMQLLPIEHRSALIAAAGGLVSSRASLASFITAASLRLLGPEDGLCLLLPAQWLESDYAASLREWLWSARKRKVELHLFPSDLFKDAQVDAVSLLVSPALEPHEQPPPLVVQGPDVSQGRQIDRDAECPAQWRGLFASPGQMTRYGRRSTRASSEASAPASGSGRAVERSLADFAKIRRGTATGANSFFVVTDAIVAEHSLPDEALAPLLRRLRAAPTAGAGSTHGESARLLVATEELRRRHAGLDGYLRDGEDRHVDETVLCSRRRPWYDLRRDLTIPDLVISPMSQGTFRIYENGDGMYILNNLYGLTWRDECTEDDKVRVQRVLSDPRTQVVLQSLARTQAGGLRKLEPKALGRVPIPGS